MRPQTYQVRLDEEATAQLLLLVRRGKAPARVIRRANVLLLASEGESDPVIAATLHYACGDCRAHSEALL